MTTTGNKVKTPEGEITPVNVWKKVQAKNCHRQSNEARRPP